MDANGGFGQCPPGPQCSRTSYILDCGLGYKAKKIRGSYVGKNEGRVRSPRSLRPTHKRYELHTFLETKESAF